MTEVRPAKSRRARAGHSYASQWNRFVAWSQASGRRCLPASPEDVAAYVKGGGRVARRKAPRAGHRFGHVGAAVDPEVARRARRATCLTEESKSAFSAAGVVEPEIPRTRGSGARIRIHTEVLAAGHCDSGVHVRTPTPLELEVVQPSMHADEEPFTVIRAA